MRPLGRIAAAKGTEVGGAIGREPLGHPEARVRAPHAELQEPDPREMFPLAIVGRLQLADLARLEQRGGELRARLRDAEVVRVADEIEHTRRVPSRVAEVGAQPLAQTTRLADVEEPPIGAEEMVHAGSGRDVLETGARHVHDEGTAVDGGPLEVEKMVDPVDAPFDRALEKDAEDLGGDMRVG